MRRTLQALLKRLTLVILLALPTLVAATWTLYPTACAALAVIRFDAAAMIEPMTKAAMGGDPWQDADAITDLRRRVQKHFLNHEVYIPLEDIVAPEAPPSLAPDGAAAASLASAMQKTCGRGKLYVWIPFKFRLPVTGEKVIEWCWKPLSNATNELGASA